MKKRVYLSGPISGRDLSECIPVFRKKEQELIELGYRVFNPFDNGLDQNEPTHRHMRRDLNILTNEQDPFDYIYMQRRWLHSGGCKLEFDVATASGIPVMFEEKDGSVHVIEFE